MQLKNILFINLLYSTKQLIYQSIVSIYNRLINGIYLFGPIVIFGSMVSFQWLKYSVLWFLFIWSSGFGLLTLSRLNWYGDYRNTYFWYTRVKIKYDRILRTSTMRSFISVFGRTCKYEYDSVFRNLQKHDKVWRSIRTPILKPCLLLVPKT